MRSNVCICFLLSFFVIPTYAQYKGLSLDAGIGFRSNISTAAMGLGFGYGEKIELHVSPSFHFVYAASGVTAGIRYNYFQSGKIILNTQISYRYLFTDRNLSIGYNNDSLIATYRVEKSNALVPQVGIAWRVSASTSTINKELLSFNLNYLVPFKTVKAEYVRGSRSTEIETIINRRYSMGLGFSITFSTYF